jgi:cytochrome c biogenesis protein CcdA
VDVIGVLSATIAGGSPWAIPIALLAGAATSVGPCAASRFLAVGSYAARSRRPSLVAGAFVAGLVAAHVPIGILAWALRDVFLSIGSFTTAVNVALGAAFVVFGVLAIARARAQEHTHAAPTAVEPRSLAAVFALGAAFALARGPGCTPPIGAIQFLTTFAGKPVLGTFLLCVFAAGHAVPIFVLGPIAKTLRSVSDRLSIGQLVSVASGSVMVWLGAVYALCA